MWAPWTIVTLTSIALWWKKREAWPYIFVGLWTFVVSAMLYGQAIYQDHVGVNVVSTGNSFVRYMLPLVPLFAWAAAALQSAISKKDASKYLTIVPVLLCALFVACGLNLALRSDKENILDSGQEIRRYAAIRDAASAQLGGQAIILSDRSDKIFFPRFRVASPRPSMETVKDLVTNVTTPVALFSTTLDAKGLAPWASAGFTLSPVFTTENQTMYVIQRSK
jgi:hypothetical protein